MANIRSARKRAIQAENRRQRNSSHQSKMRTYIKKTVNAIEAGDREIAKVRFSTAASVIDRMVSKGIIHKNKAARHKSRLSSAIKLI